MIGSLQSLCVRAMLGAPACVTARLCSADVTTALKMVVLHELTEHDLLDGAAFVGDLLASDDNLLALDLGNTLLSPTTLRNIAQHAPAVQTLGLAKSSTTANVSRASWRKLAAALAPLTTLNMSHMQSRSLLSSFAANCERLQCVRASHTPITDGELAQLLQRCPLLQELAVRGCDQLTDSAFVRGLPERSFLLRLDVRSCTRLTDATLLAVAARCPTLLSLALEQQHFVEGITAVLNGCLELAALAMPLCFVDEPALLRIRNTNCHVRSVDLFGTRLRAETMLFLFGNVFRSLHTLNLAGARWLTLDVLKFVCLRSPRLQSLSLKGHITLLTDEFLDVVATHLHELQSLDLGLCRAVSNAAVARLVGTLPSTFRELGLVGVAVIEDSTIQLLAERCGASLEKISLGGCKRITNVGLAALAAHCKQLRCLCIKGTSVTDPAGLIQLVCNNPLLRVISLSGVAAATDAVVTAIAAHCAELSTLYVSGLRVQSATMEQFRRVRPKVAVHGKRRRVSAGI